MARSGRSIEKEITPEQVEQLLYKHGGKITHIAKELQITPPTLYNYLDVHEELKEVKAKAEAYLADYELDSAYELLDRRMQDEEDKSNGLKAAQLVLTKSRKSRYYDDKKESSDKQAAAGIVELMQTAKAVPAPILTALEGATPEKKQKIIEAILALAEAEDAPVE